MPAAHRSVLGVPGDKKNLEVLARNPRGFCQLPSVHTARQADVRRNPLFYDGTLTAASYRAWLANWSVGYVVLPTAEPDGAGVAEAKVIAAGPPWLRLVWQDPDWRIYKVQDPEPMVAAPATVTHAGPASLTVHLPEPGSAVLRIAWSPWLAIDGTTPGGACLIRSGEWTELITPTAGTFTIEARYAVGRGTPCPTPSS